ncbi:MAG: hypothetical protein LQ344_001962 [Seirophora lacunosa]|nr:MAG: hypothetical protein LQ344_001962 [Seirophora lacunosa]
MTSVINVQTAVIAVIIYVGGWITYCRFFHPLSGIPGPFVASFSRIWVVFKTLAGDMEHTQRNLHKKHGYLVRIAPNEVACSDPEAIRVTSISSAFGRSAVDWVQQIIYNIKNPFAKTDFYDAWAPPVHGYVGHFPTRDEKQHAERRRIVNSVYSMSSVLESEGAVDSCTKIFYNQMQEFARQGCVVDLGRWINMYAFDVLGELFYGNMFGFMHEHKDIGGYMKTIDSMLPAFSVGGTVPSYLTKLYFLSTVIISPSVRRAVGAVQLIDNASKTAIERRRLELAEKQDNRRDLLRKMLDINAERGEKVNYTYQDICVESQSSLFAGADTTAIAINSVLYHLMRNPTAYRKLTAEIDAAVQNGTLSLPIAYADAIKLPYLRACINEGMRLHPSVGLTMPRTIPPGGATISGYRFAAGYRIGMNGAVVQYDEDVFGPDASAFKPERWIDGGGDVARMQRTMLVFGAGTRTCIGKNISLSEIYKLIPHIMRSFHIRLAEPAKEWRTRNYWFNKQSGILVHVEERTLA